MSDFETIHWSLDDGVGRIVLDRPDVLNAMSERTLVELERAFERFDEADAAGEGVTTRAVVISGAGDEAFSAGADIGEFGEVDYPLVDQQWQATMAAIAECPVPVIAKIDGYCIGGGLEMALACDFRFASTRSELGFSEIDLGLIPNGGGTARLVKTVGRSRAKELCITGEFLGGERALEDGLVDRVAPAEELDGVVETFVETVASKPPLAVRVVKEVTDHAEEVGLADALAYEHRASLPLYYTDDYEEGVAAFQEDREPEWTGR